MRESPRSGDNAWLLIAALGVMSCGRIGFDPLARVDNDGSIPGNDGSMPVGDGGADAHPDAGPLTPQPGAPISDSAADPDCPVVAWTGAEFVVAWTDQRDGTAQIHVARLDEDGAKIGSDVRVTMSTSQASNPAIAGTGDGFALSWSDDRDGNGEIYMARFTGAATRIGGETRVTNAAESSSHSSLAVTGDGYAVSWQDWRDGNIEIYAARLDASGTKLGSDVRVMNASGLSLDPSVLWTGSEQVIAWRDESAGGGSQLFVARLDASGNEIGQEKQITTEARTMLSQSIVWTGAETLAVWEDFRSGDFEIYGARIDESGDKIGDDIAISTGAAGGGGVEPALAWNGFEAGMAWQDNRDGNGADIFVTRLTAAGGALDSEMAISDAPGVSRCADIVWTGSQYGVAWLNDQSGAMTIYFARVLQ